MNVEHGFLFLFFLQKNVFFNFFGDCQNRPALICPYPLPRTLQTHDSLLLQTVWGRVGGVDWCAYVWVWEGWMGVHVWV